jgi:hypothetical protein
MDPFDPNQQHHNQGHPVQPHTPQPGYHEQQNAASAHGAFTPPMPPASAASAPSWNQPAPAAPSWDEPAAPADNLPFGPDGRDPLAPTPVVKVLSPVGVEYVFLTLTLLIGAVALVSALLVIVHGGASFAGLAFPAATLLVTLPLFAGIFLHLKKLELRHPRLRFDPSKRRSTQATQIISFIVCLFTLIGFFAAIFAAIGGTGGVSIGKAALDALVVLGVAGGILFYYWRDEHATRL